MLYRVIPLLLFLGFSVPCTAEESFVNDPYQFAIAAVDCLQSGRIALYRSMDSQAKDSSIANNMKSASLLRLELEKAAQLIKLYTSSNNEYISTAATELAITFEMLATSYVEYLNILERALNDADFNLRQGTYTRQLGDVSARIDETWRMIPTVASGISFALIDHNVGPSGTINRLSITQEQRDELIDSLEHAFPEPIKAEREGIQGDKQAIDVAGTLLWEWLNGDWLASDAPD